MLGLEYIRKLYGDTTVTLAEKLEISNVNISQWENGKKPIPEKRLEELSSIYNVSSKIQICLKHSFFSYGFKTLK